MSAKSKNMFNAAILEVLYQLVRNQVLHRLLLLLMVTIHVSRRSGGPRFTGDYPSSSLSVLFSYGSRSPEARDIGLGITYVAQYFLRVLAQAWWRRCDCRVRPQQLETGAR